MISQAPGDKEIVVSGGFTDEQEIKSSKENSDVSHLSSTHEEADTRLVLHAVYSQHDIVVVASRDTDVLLLLVSHFSRAYCSELWMLSGSSKKNWYFPIHTIVEHLPDSIIPDYRMCHNIIYGKSFKTVFMERF